MSVDVEFDQTRIREAIAGFEISPSVAPNDTIDIERVFFPITHRGVLDVKRQLVVGNRGMGKSFWTHALTNPDVRERLARAYSFPKLAKTQVIIGFNGSIKISGVTATIEEIQTARIAGDDAELIWRAVILRATRSLRRAAAVSSFVDTLNQLRASPGNYAKELTAAD